MKLILCMSCQDIFKLQSKKRHCMCRTSWGRYLGDDDHAEIGGEAVPIGLGNRSLASALANRPQEGLGVEFKAFVIPESTDKIVQHGDIPEKPSDPLRPFDPEKLMKLLTIHEEKSR